MEGAGVALSTVQLLVGQIPKKTMGTRAVYTQGERVDLRKAIDRLRYSRAVMRLLPRNLWMTKSRADAVSELDLP